MAVAVASRRAIERAQALGTRARWRGRRTESIWLKTEETFTEMYSTSSRRQQRQSTLAVGARLRLAEDRLAELVEVQPHARAAPLSR
jgi:hypothetical protein